MRVTVKQLKALIREAAEEAMQEMQDVGEGDHMEEAAKEEEAALHEAVTKAFRAGYQRGVKAATTRKATR
jgi:hypothetical protein